MTINDIVERGDGFKRLRIGVLKNNEAYLRMDYIPDSFHKFLGERNIYIKTSHSRLNKLANDILTELHRSAKIAEWKPTFQELEHQILQQSNGLDLWLIDLARSSVAMQRKDVVLQLVSVYDWLKGNEEWLYRARDAVKQ